MSRTKIIYLVRHGQAEHNISEQNPQGNSSVKDPNLTPLGRSQCQDLRSRFPHHSSVEIVLASPLRRTIQTAVTAFGSVLSRPEVPLLLVPLAQEISARPCDTGTDPEVLEAAMQDVLVNVDVKVNLDGRIDYGLLEEGWNGKAGKYEASLKAVEQRAAELRRFLWKRPETSIVLVTHGAFLHYLTEDWTGLIPPRGTAYKTCEFRTFKFDESSNEENAHLVEIGGPPKQGIRPVGAHAHDITGVEPFPGAELPVQTPAAE
ncbi:Phosphoglycerate mutase-like protein [Venustampulla echinocandica]|uniref:Phosphoglycerate mutase-like protein n=1 Tax=Venustampulla echinocandica TaxID=2656787 RepID=A0A370TSX6_9HELO|nr:Phosphoglycerate mutase-like protein [Venustampulla echinocandica]RDL38594.1 Phosphoglycerate mutase-like protein [Venustampulla echinocandica]